MPTNRFSCGIVIPVRNEDKVLRKTVPALLAAVKGNAPASMGTTVAPIKAQRKFYGLQAVVVRFLRLLLLGKTLALQAGDELLDAEQIFPRLYLDADTWLRPGDIGRLFKPLRKGEADLVAASHAFDYSSSSLISAHMARCWLALPFAKNAAFLGAVAVSSTGRAQWDEWPSVIADDMFMAGIVNAGRQMMVTNAVAMTWAPSTFSEWVSMRSRWLRGERQVVELGLSLPSAPTQRVDLVRRLIDPRTSLGALAFCLARILAIASTECMPPSLGILHARAIELIETFRICVLILLC